MGKVGMTAMLQWAELGLCLRPGALRTALSLHRCVAERHFSKGLSQCLE